MKIINALNNSLTLPLVRAATSGYALAKCRIHPAQLAAYELLVIRVKELIVEQLEDGYPLPDLPAPGPRTVVGIPVELDLEFPLSRMQFLDADGVAVTEIESLAIPSGFWPA